MRPPTPTAPGTETATMLEIREVSKSFGGVQAVGRVSLDVRPGEILSVIGPNGAGKTTLLNMISGFYHPDTGRIALEGRDITHLAPSRVAALGIARDAGNGIGSLAPRVRIDHRHLRPDRGRARRPRSRP